MVVFHFSIQGEIYLSVLMTSVMLLHVYKYRHEYEHVGLTLITVFCDAMYDVMPPLGGGLWRCTSYPNLLRWGGHMLVCCLVFSCLVLGM